MTTSLAPVEIDDSTKLAQLQELIKANERDTYKVKISNLPKYSMYPRLQELRVERELMEEVHEKMTGRRFTIEDVPPPARVEETPKKDEGEGGDDERKEPVAV